MKKMMLLLFIAFSIHNAIAQKHVGIGTSNPLAALHVADSSVLFTGPATLPVIATLPPVSGAGTRMMWYADKAAFRTGIVTGTSWDMPNVGPYSFATGINTTASGDNSTALGNFTFASGIVSTAMGLGTTASGNYSTAMGYGAKASGDYSTAMGYSATASGDYSLAAGVNNTASGGNAVAIGNFTIASGLVSTAMGYVTRATGSYSTATGQGTTASGIASTAMGSSVSTNNFTGSFIIGDNSAAAVSNCFRANEFRTRFDGGYALYTNAATTTGVFMLNGDNAWSSISDSTKKEKFKKTDGEYVLNSIDKMKLGSWNYKSQNAKQYRHYGAMAQEFYKAFGNDGIGKIGCDTLINSADIDGVMMIGLQALEKRSSIIIRENAELKADNLALQKEIAGIKE